MNLKLSKQRISNLSADEMNKVKGGGLSRSNRRAGNCLFSRRYGVTTFTDDNGNTVATGCYPSSGGFMAIFGIGAAPTTSTQSTNNTVK